MIIDFHTHTFPSRISARVAEELSHLSHSVYYIEPNVQKLSESMKDAGIDLSVNLPVMTRPDQVVPVNDRLIRSMEEDLSLGIMSFGGLHPLFEDYKKEIRRLREAGIRGIKIHPAYQGVDLNDIRFKRIIGAISEEGLITITHAGQDIGIPEKNYASVPMILDVIRDVAPERFVLAHSGGWQGWDEVRSDLAGADVWIDTSFSCGPLEPKPGEEERLHYRYNMTKEQFAGLVQAHGAERVLFATDSPWAPQKEYVEFIRGCGFSDDDTEKILGGNAAALLEF